MIDYVYVGIACSVTGNILISLALNIQKYAHTKLQNSVATNEDALLNNDELQPVSSFGTLASSSSSGNSKLDTNYLTSPYWWLGAMVMTIGETGNFVAYGFAPVSVVSPLGIVTIIANCSIAPLIFHEPLRIRDFIGTVLASLGVLLVIVSSIDNSKNDSNDDSDPSELIYSLLTSKRYFYYTLCSAALAAFLIVRLNLLKTNLHHYISSRNYGMKNVYTFGNILLVAIFGAHTAMATKCLSTLIEFSTSIWSLILQVQTYYLVFVLVVTAVCQIKHLNNSLRVESSTKVIPVHFVFFTISVLLGSAVVFGDQKNKQSWQIVLFLLGCCLTFLSVFLIAGGSKPEINLDAEVNINDTTDSQDNFVTGVSGFNTKASQYYSAIGDNQLPNKNNQNKHTFQYSEFAFKVPSLTQFGTFQKNTNDAKVSKKESKSSVLSANKNNNFLTDSLLHDVQQDLYMNNPSSSESVPILSRSTSINDFYSGNNANSERAGFGVSNQFANHLAIPKPNRDQDDIHSSRSLPGDLTTDIANHHRLLNRSQSFNRILDFNNSNSELIGIPGSGSVILNHVLLSFNANRI